MRESGRFVRGAACIVLALAMLGPASVRAEEEGGCAREVLSPYLAALPGWKISAFEAKGGGARMVLERDGDPKYLLIALALEGTRLHTFTSVHGSSGDSTVPADIARQLNAQWDKLWKDPAAQKCPLLAVQAAPVGDEWYQRLEAQYRGLQPEAALPGVSPVDAEEESDDLAVALTVGFFLVAAAVLIALFIRHRRRPATPAAATPPSPPSPPAPPDEPETPQP